MLIARPTADLTGLLDALLAPVDHDFHRFLLKNILHFVFGDRRITGERLREKLISNYQCLDVTGDAIPEAAIGRLINLPMGRHRRAVEVIDTMLIARPRRIAGNEQQDDVASLSNSSGGSRPQVDHPGDPPDGEEAFGQ
jgi:hypothetical protein